MMVVLLQHQVKNISVSILWTIFSRSGTCIGEKLWWFCVVFLFFYSVKFKWLSFKGFFALFDRIEKSLLQMWSLFCRLSVDPGQDLIVNTSRSLWYPYEDEMAKHKGSDYVHEKVLSHCQKQKWTVYQDKCLSPHQFLVSHLSQFK